MKKIILFGDGGHCQSCIELVKSSKKFTIQYIITNSKKKKIYNINTLVECDNTIKFLLRKKLKNVLISFGQIYDYKKRYNLFCKLKKKGFFLPTIISKNSIVSKNLVLGEGSVIMQNCFVNFGVKIGQNTIINNSTNIEHGVKIGNNCHVSTGVIINGDCVIGDNCFIGSGSIIKHGATIKKNSFIKMGSIIK